MSAIALLLWNLRGGLHTWGALVDHQGVEKLGLRVTDVAGPVDRAADVAVGLADGNASGHGDAQRYARPLREAGTLDSLPQVPHAARGRSACRARPFFWGVTSTDLSMTLE